MEIRKYIVETTQISIAVAATNLASAIEQVMNYELCPLSAIMSVTTFDEESALKAA